MTLLKKLPTADGSYTLERTDLGETYHSRKGAITESVHIYIQEGLQIAATYKAKNGLLNILEVGFGTGLNCLLSALNAPCEIQYTGIDNFPLEHLILLELEYTQQVNHPKAANTYHQIITAPWNSAHFSHLTDTAYPMYFLKRECALLNFNTPNKFDLVFYDAFAPKYQPEMWNEAAMTHITNLIQPRGILVTYCAQGNFRRLLQNLGWHVDRIPGPAGFKKEMIRAFAP
jgi:tRNA U34 5-methylaminomethyl-2-thiouridine-forming methyltransferase MnmC